MQSGAMSTATFLEGEPRPAPVPEPDGQPESCEERDGVVVRHRRRADPVLRPRARLRGRGGPEQPRGVSRTLRRRAAHADPPRRLWLSGYHTQNKPLVAHVTALNQARKAAIKASSAFVSTPVCPPRCAATATATTEPRTCDRRRC